MSLFKDLISPNFQCSSFDFSTLTLNCVLLLRSHSKFTENLILLSDPSIFYTSDENILAKITLRETHIEHPVSTHTEIINFLQQNFGTDDELISFQDSAFLKILKVDYKKSIIELYLTIYVGMASSPVDSFWSGDSCYFTMSSDSTADIWRIKVTQNRNEINAVFSKE